MFETGAPLSGETSGFCLSTSADGADTYTDTCHVKSGDFNPYCYKKALTGNPAQQDSDLHVTDYCSAADHNEAAPDDHAEYDENTSTDGSGTPTKIWKSVNGAKKYFVIDGDKIKLTDNEGAATTFTRYNAKAANKSDKGTFQANGQCLTEVYPGDKIGGVSAYARTDGKPDVRMAACGSSTDYLDRSIKSQVWNAAVQWDSSGPSGGGGSGGSSGGTVVTTHEASQYKGYVTSKEIGATYTGW